MNKSDFELEKADFSNIKDEKRKEEESRKKPKYTIETLQEWRNELINIDPVEGGKIEKLFDKIESASNERLEIIALQVRVSLSGAKDSLIRNSIYREDLLEMKNSLTESCDHADLLAEIEDTLSGEALIDDKIFRPLENKFERRNYLSEDLSIAREIESEFKNTAESSPDFFSNLLLERLKNKNYEMFDDNGKQIKDFHKKAFAEIDLGPEYFAQIKTADDGQVSLRIVRVVAEESEIEDIDENQRRKDREATKQFCSFCKKLHQELGEDGILNDLHEDRDEDEDILVIVNKELALEGVKKSSESREGKGVLQTQKMTSD
jgi:hypothetical protein